MHWQEDIFLFHFNQGCPRPKFTKLQVPVQVPVQLVVPVQVDETKPAVVVVPVQVDETAQNRRDLDITVSRQEFCLVS